MHASTVSVVLLFSLLKTGATETDRQALIRTINEKHTTWVAGENFPENVTLDSLKLLNGARGIHPDKSYTIQIKTHKIARSSIPETFDAREQWSYCKDVIGNIRDQGHCGSCWAFAAAEGFSDRLCIQNEGRETFQFSPEDLLQCCSGCVDRGQDTCGGGYLAVAWQYWVNMGVVSGGDLGSETGCKPYSSFAYNFNIGPKVCEQVCHSAYKKSYTEDKKYGSSAYGVSKDVEQIQTEIMTNGPVTAIYRVFADFYNYRYGVYQHVVGGYTGNHAIKIIGWGTENGVPYWLVANSWGKDWGDLSGFFKILRGENHCGIEESVIAGKSSAIIHLSAPVCISLMIVFMFVVRDVIYS